jgi:hypothetical protein
MDEFNRHPVVHTWSYKLDKAAWYDSNLEIDELDTGDTSIGIRLIADLKAILEERGVDRIFSEDLAQAPPSNGGPPMVGLEGQADNQDCDCETPQAVQRQHFRFKNHTRRKCNIEGLLAAGLPGCIRTIPMRGKVVLWKRHIRHNACGSDTSERICKRHTGCLWRFRKAQETLVPQRLWRMWRAWKVKIELNREYHDYRQQAVGHHRGLASLLSHLSPQIEEQLWSKVEWSDQRAACYIQDACVAEVGENHHES